MKKKLIKNTNFRIKIFPKTKNCRQKMNFLFKKKKFSSKKKINFSSKKKKLFVKKIKILVKKNKFWSITLRYAFELIFPVDIGHKWFLFLVRLFLRFRLVRFLPLFYLLSPHMATNTEHIILEILIGNIEEIACKSYNLSVYKEIFFKKSYFTKTEGCNKLKKLQIYKLFSRKNTVLIDGISFCYAIFVMLYFGTLSL